MLGSYPAHQPANPASGAGAGLRPLGGRDLRPLGGDPLLQVALEQQPEPVPAVGAQLP
jgi:hypothetical protein